MHERATGRGRAGERAPLDVKRPPAVRSLAMLGVATPGVRIPVERLEPAAIYSVPGEPDWLAVDPQCEQVWVANMPRHTVSRLDPTSSQATSFTVGRNPCSGLAAAFGSLWVPSCGDSSVKRLDLTDGSLQASIPLSIACDEGGVSVGAGSFWILTDGGSSLARIDPLTNQVRAHVRVAAGSFACAFGEGSVWVTSWERGVVTRIDAATLEVQAVIAVGPQPRFLTVGEGAVWTLNQADGSISRIDPQTNRLAATIEANVPGTGGEIAAGAGSVWVTTFGHPITRIDPRQNRVVQQFFGPGGDAIRVGLGWVWLANLRFGTVWRIDPRRILAASAD